MLEEGNENEILHDDRDAEGRDYDPETECHLSIDQICGDGEMEWGTEEP